MFRLVLSIILVLTFAGASAASVMHGVNHGTDHADHHVEMTEDSGLADAEKALADCCDSTAGMGSAFCFGDLVATVEVLPVAPKAALTSEFANARSDFLGLSLGVPTGPPKA